MSSSSLSELDSDSPKPQKSSGNPQQDPEPAKPAKKSPRATKASKPPPATSGGPQSSPATKPKKRSAGEAELDPAPAPKKASAKSPPAKKPAPARGEPQSNPRPARARRPPSRLAEESEAKPTKGAPKRTSPSPPPKKTKQEKPKAKEKKKKADKWSAEHLLHHPASRLADLEASALKRVLLDERAWRCLSADEKRELVELLPEDSLPRLLEDNTEPDMVHEYLRYNEVFADGLGRFLEQLAGGELDREWQAQAAEAMEMRVRGDFDEWKEREWEEYWGQKHTFVPATVATGGDAGGSTGEMEAKEKLAEEAEKKTKATK
ncbi:MAG: hypothetical protein M1821_002622 [Bathelium mastoideum]|nr:MAG: hypothetical protein M1821_002622 [Bathelium mastoideum]KAI9685517.1 MAG: hypothetical protein M1822_004375 [Bathelium mastoideum]